MWRQKVKNTLICNATPDPVNIVSEQSDTIFKLFTGRPQLRVRLHLAGSRVRHDRGAGQGFVLFQSCR